MGSKGYNYTLLPTGKPVISTAVPRKRSIWPWALSLSLILAILLCLAVSDSDTELQLTQSQRPDSCPQYSDLKPLSDENQRLEKEIEKELASSDFFQKSVKRMQGAVRVPTESFDDMGQVGKDPRWDIFAEFHDFLADAFPLVFGQLRVTKVNTHGLLLEWPGTAPSLKPYLFMGHTDVVPVPAATTKRWTYPPFSGHFDGRFVWGRGACDCKNVVIGVLEAWEILLENGFKPERTLFAGFGFDEEISGPQGAQYISAHLEEKLGKDSIELIIDEGGLGIRDLYGSIFALPGLGEKGYYDVTITVDTVGGHSSIPPPHTGIGILAQIITAIEDSPFTPLLTPANPFFTTLQCAAQHGPSMESDLRNLIFSSLTSESSAQKVADKLSSEDVAQRYLMQTSQATDLISGGVKINALPEKVEAVVNHRIAIESSVSEVQEHITSIISKKILTKFPLALDAFGSISGITNASSAGTITLSSFDEPLEPAPVSPFTSPAYKLLSGTIKKVFGEEVIVSPSVMTGNTDTKFYWGLSRDIYRFAPVRDTGRENIHTVDEKMGMTEHVEGIRFYVALTLGA